MKTIKSVNPGYCYKKAGWKRAGYTQGGLVALQLLPDAMPAPALPNGAQLALDWEVA